MKRLSLLLPLILALPVTASEAAGSGTWLGLPLWFWALVNFIIFFGGIGYLLAKPMGAFFRTRREEIARDLEEARHEREEQERMKAEVEQRLAALHGEIAALHERLRAEGEKERDELSRQGDAEAARLLAQIEQETGRRLEEARTGLAKEAASIAADLAWEILEKEITAEDRERIFRTTLERLRSEAEGGLQ